MQGKHEVIILKLVKDIQHLEKASEKQKNVVSEYAKIFNNLEAAQA